MAIHELKIENQFLFDLLEGRKKAEIRKNDRNYRVGDYLFFNNPVPDVTPTVFVFRITHIQSGYGLQDNIVALSVERDLR